MADRSGSKNKRSYLAIDELDRLGVNPIERLMKIVEELDQIKRTALEAYQTGRGMTEKGDAGPAYLGQAMAATSKKSDIYTTLAKFKHPTLSAIALKEVQQSESEKLTERVVDAAHVRDTILKDPMAQVPTLIAGKSNDEKT